MDKAEPYYIVALREPGSHGPVSSYVICKTLSVVERTARKAGKDRSPVNGSIATFLDGEFAHAVSGKKYEAIGWKGGAPIFDGATATALSLGTADQD